MKSFAIMPRLRSSGQLKAEMALGCSYFFEVRGLPQHVNADYYVRAHLSAAQRSTDSAARQAAGFARLARNAGGAE